MITSRQGCVCHAEVMVETVTYTPYLSSRKRTSWSFSRSTVGVVGTVGVGGAIGVVGTVVWRWLCWVPSRSMVIDSCDTAFLTCVYNKYTLKKLLQEYVSPSIKSITFNDSGIRPYVWANHKAHWVCDLNCCIFLRACRIDTSSTVCPWFAVGACKSWICSLNCSLKLVIIHGHVYVELINACL